MIGFPLVYGDFNNWTPQRMYTIEELCYIMDSEKPDIIKNLKRSNFIRENVDKVDDMNEKERSYYSEQVYGLMSKYHRMKNWRKLLGSSLRYKKPFLANAEALLLGSEEVNIAKMDEELYPSDSESDFGSNSELQSSIREVSNSESSMSEHSDAESSNSESSDSIARINKKAKAEQEKQK